MKEAFNRNRSSSSFIIAHVDASKESLVERLLASVRSAQYRPYDLLDLEPTSSSANTNDQTQSVSAKYSYANFQETLFANSEKPEQDDYVLIEKNYINDQNQPYKGTSQCCVM